MIIEGGEGAIVNTISISALKALPDGGAYSSSKGRAAASRFDEASYVNGALLNVDGAASA